MKTKSITKHIKPEHVGFEMVKELKKMENIEDLGTSMYHTTQQFYLLLQSILTSKFGLTEKDLKVLNQEMTKAVEGLAWFEEKGLNPMSVQSIAQLVDVTMNHYVQFKAQKAGITLPESKTAKNLLGN